ncbi:unnamed protein product [Caenorhabditis auriculariae]|uniref:Uncharacterized protein n=1 Tax=Caenorhabditis auriculariae TaxID=2777116 RepID=A0A8S1GS57_9PELO|nr:unnamed protein product [Caenorhabditis auriculariae]
MKDRGNGGGNRKKGNNSRKVNQRRKASTSTAVGGAPPTRITHSCESVNSVDEQQSVAAKSERDKPEKPLDNSIFFEFVRRALEKKPIGLRAEFLAMKRSNDFSVMTAFVAANEKGQNRYKDVGCLDNCRVTLGTPWPHDYIHANYVSTPSRPKKFICTQAPMEKTCADFWFMCLSERVEIIMMLCNFIEKGANKCWKYFPEYKETMTFTEGPQKILVKCTRVKNLSWGESKLKESTFYVEGVGKTMKIKHIHWIDWPDRCVPSPDMTVIKILDRYRSKNPIVVHCSAGIGRTGSVVMIEYILEQLESHEKITPSDEILLKIRKQRNNSVQTEHQYLFVHQVILNYLLKKKYLDEHGDRLIREFYEEYKKVVV